MKWASFLYLGELPCIFLFASASNILSFALTMSWNISKSFFIVKALTVSLPPRHIHLFYHNHFTYNIDKFSSSNFSGHLSRVSLIAAVNSSNVNTWAGSYCFSSSIYVTLKFHFQYYYFLFLERTFVFFCSSPSLGYTFFLAYHVSLSLKTGKQQNNILLCLCELNSWYWGIFYWLVTDYKVHLLFT